MEVGERREGRVGGGRGGRGSQESRASDQDSGVGADSAGNHAREITIEMKSRGNLAV